MTLTKTPCRALILIAGLMLATPLLANEANAVKESNESNETHELTVKKETRELSVRIEGIADKGKIHLYVFTGAEGFPKEEHAVLHQAYPRPPRGQTALELRISVPEAAEYALMSFQDKDGDGKMKRLLGMIPQEPYGLSRNPKLFGKPKFAEAAISASGETIVIKLHD